MVRWEGTAIVHQKDKFIFVGLHYTVTPTHHHTVMHSLPHTVTGKSSVPEIFFNNCLIGGQEKFTAIIYITFPLKPTRTYYTAIYMYDHTSLRHSL